MNTDINNTKIAMDILSKPVANRTNVSIQSPLYFLFLNNSSSIALTITISIIASDKIKTPIPI